MTELEYKALSSSTISDLNLMLKKLTKKGWKPVGDIEVFGGQYVQPIKISMNLDITEEITQEIIN